MKTNYKKMGDRIKSARKKKKITQEQLAEMTGLSNNYISNIERNCSIPSIDTLLKICNSLGITPDFVLLDSIYTSNEYLKDEIIFARVAPEQKLRVVSNLQEMGEIVAITGDGVNDSPALKKADIGVAMGRTGTDVTKEASAMILADDNFATIVNAVEEGRKIYDNIRKAIQFLLASNLSEVLSIFFATILGFTILHPVHILWINLITDTFPALALGMEEGEDDLMRRSPRSSKEGVFSGGVGFDIVYQGLLISIVTIAAYLIGHRMESGIWEIATSPDGITMAFLTMSMAEIFQSLNMRSQRGSIFKMTRQNKYLLGAMVVSLILTTTVISVPFLADLFEFEHISLMEYGVAMLLAVSVIPIVEIVKWIQRKISK